jgi:hypothetical protein
MQQTKKKKKQTQTTMIQQSEPSQQTINKRANKQRGTKGIKGRQRFGLPE